MGSALHIRPESVPELFISSNPQQRVREKTIINHGAEPWVFGSCSNKLEYLLNSSILVLHFIIQKQEEGKQDLCAAQVRESTSSSSKKTEIPVCREDSRTSPPRITPMCGHTPKRKPLDKGNALSSCWLPAQGMLAVGSLFRNRNHFGFVRVLIQDIPTGLHLENSTTVFQGQSCVMLFARSLPRFRGAQSFIKHSLAKHQIN